MVEQEQDELIGRVLNDTYQLERRLGSGGMGAVYAARHLRTGRLHAAKVLLDWGVACAKRIAMLDWLKAARQLFDECES